MSLICVDDVRVAHWNNVRPKRAEYLSLRCNHIDQWNYEEKYRVYGVVYFPANASPRGVGANQFPILIGFDLVNTCCG